MSSTKARVIGATAAIAACLGAIALTSVQAAAGGGPDDPRCFGTAATVDGLVGTPGDDVIVGTNGDDEIEGRGGDDRICAKEGRDFVLTGAGDDRGRGGVGRDFINGQGGNDHLFGNSGDDGPNKSIILFRRGMASFGIIGGPGNDKLGGGSGNDQLEGQDGTDHHGGGIGYDRCYDEDPDSTFNSCEKEDGGGKGGVF